MMKIAKKIKFSSISGEKKTGEKCDGKNHETFLML